MDRDAEGPNARFASHLRPRDQLAVPARQGVKRPLLARNGIL